MIRAFLFALVVSVLWSGLWFQPDGVTFFIPGLGGYHWEYH